MQRPRKSFELDGPLLLRTHAHRAGALLAAQVQAVPDHGRCAKESWLLQAGQAPNPRCRHPTVCLPELESS